MAETIRDVMTTDPITVEPTMTCDGVAHLMRDSNVGDVIVTEAGNVRGIVTDRDIVVRVVADGRDPASVPCGDICSGDLETISPDTPIREAAELMRRRAVRRLPVVEGGRATGIVSIGDLAIERDSDSVLADISAASPNR